MAVLFFDGFDCYSSASDLFGRWTLYSSIFLGTNYGRFGGGGIYGTLTSSALDRALGSTITTLIVGMAVYQPYGAYTQGTLVEFRLGGATQCHLRATTAAGLELVRNTTVVASSAAGVLPLQSWFHLEFKATIAAGTGGAAEVRVNGTTMLTISGANLANTGSAGADTVRHSGATNYIRFDDIYYLDTTGSVANDFLGDTRVTTLVPNADISKQWAPSTGTTNYTCIDETTINTADYVGDSTIGHRDVYGLTDLSGTPVVHAVWASAWAAKSDAGTRGIKLGIRSGASEAQTADTALSTSTGCINRLQTTDPASSAQWTAATVNAATLTLEVSS